MRKAMTILALLAACVAWSADGALAETPTSRDVQAAVDGYLAGGPEAQLVGGPGSAGYDGGFWIRGGDFSLKINLTLQARYEYADYDDSQPFETETGLGGDLSGFSLPRATLKFSGTAPCNICYYMELEFGHYGLDFLSDEFEPGNELPPISAGGLLGGQGDNLGTLFSQSFNFDNTREAWIEWCYCPSFNLRMGQIRTPNTRQLLVAPELQQFVDISLASSMTGWLMPGYTDRNRDHGVMAHGAFGCNNEWSYMIAVTNGDGGDSIRNVLDPRTSDNLAYSGRLNWAFLEPIGYQEGALNNDTCSWYGEAGAWAYYYADRVDKNHEVISDTLLWGLDLAMGYGGFSFTGAFTMGDFADVGGSGEDITYTAYLAQLGYHFPGTAWEIAARWSSWTLDADSASEETTTTEYAFGVNYYLNGHSNKLQLDVTLLSGEDILFPDVYGGWLFGIGDEDYVTLFRFQWQLAL